MFIKQVMARPVPVSHTHLINDMDRNKDACRHQSNNRVIMWYKIRELYSKGFNKTQIAFQLGPVSYTHLDVYKRQMMYLVKNRSLIP